MSLWYSIHNIKDIRFYFKNKGTSNIRFQYTICRHCSSEYQLSGEEKISASSSTVIKIPYLKQLYYTYMYILFSFSADDLAKIHSFSLSFCEVEMYGCPRNHYGSPCRPCLSNCDKCNAIDGSCICQAGYTGVNCTDVCSNNTYGANCVYSCGHCYNDTCNHVTGNCLFGCTEGWTSSKCNQACSSGYYGRDCTQRCSSHCITPYLCERFNGTCIGGCATGWTNDTCDKVDTDYCVDWAPSDVSVSYHNMTWRRENINNIIRFDPAVTFLCNFSLKSDEELLYDVIWFIDGQEVVIQTVDKSSNYKAVITAHDMLKAEKKIGSDVHCKVGAKRKRKNLPCLYKVGNPFFAGIK
ncbi:tyrosine-protein kinase receptor Tie-1-like, partial [Saccostrea cucullata]|uniref:tyrosine-protein kinase receptor Tie-1-like n=1 Tax=Saccostrea cuccullata TaxID=36930 RepID=UPI002ED196BF